MANTMEERAPSTELEELRERRKKILQLQIERSAVAKAARELLEKASTSPRPRSVVEAELATAERFDLPMLAHELAMVDHAIAKLEAARQSEEPPLAAFAHHTEPRRLVRKRRRLQLVVKRRQMMVERADGLRAAVNVAVAALRDPGEERAQLRAAISEIEKLDGQIDRLGAELKRTSYPLKRGPAGFVEINRQFLDPSEGAS